jgi:thiamine pyrophosphate-dependent acetolactate synthase large subunit-like protein
MMDYVREAFHLAKHERRPVVLGVPYDLQKVEYMANAPYETSAMYRPKAGRMHPDPEVVAEVVERLAAAKRPIIFGGRGVLWSGARDAAIRLADRCGALLSNTLPARGLFHDHPFGLGIAGSYFSSLGREMYESADVVLAVGTSLSYYVGSGRWTMRRAACATGRRPPTSTSDRMRSSASRRSLPASTGSWASADRRRRRYDRKSSRIASRPSRRTRCRSTSRPTCWIRAR